MGHYEVLLVFLPLLPKPSSSSWCEKEPLLSKKLLPQPPTRFTSRCFTSTTGDVMQQNRKSQSCKSAAAVCSEAARLSGCCKELEDVERPEPRSAIVKNKSLDEVDEERETS